MNDADVTMLNDFRARIVRARDLRLAGDFAGAAAVEPSNDELRRGLELLSEKREAAPLKAVVPTLASLMSKYGEGQ